ncbi:MAG TPA: FG-GAP-like repeat-containing protein [Frankiaceae bacterium]|nr:FG-GAP-like repeat-containing protein [Frankiaceae bacterium]
MRRRALWGALLAAALCAAVAPVHAPATTLAPITAPALRASAIADFDGDGRDDLYWAGPDAAPESFWFGAGERFLREDVPLAGTARPLHGDFDGDGRGDLLHYAAGTGADRVWYGGADRGMTEVATRVNGTYDPLVGDFDGDGRDDVLWYGPGRAGDYLWLGSADRAFRGRAITVNMKGRATVGDFDGDGRSDLRWQAPGNATDAVWYATPGGFAPVRAPKVDERYAAAAGDFDGDGTADLLWYRGASRAYLEPGSRLRLPRHVAVDLPSGGETAVGDFNGDGFGDVLVSAGSRSVVLHGRPATVPARVDVTAPSGRTPVVGDYDGDGRDDVYWTGRTPEYRWHWDPLGRIVTSRVAVAANRLAALDQAAWDEDYEPYGYVAHAMGGIEGVPYTNSLEAFRRSYELGFRVFEVDFITLGDGSIWALHNNLEHRLGLDKHFREATSDDVRGLKFDGKYTILSAGDVLSLMRAHRDIHVVVDTKWDHVDIVARLLRTARDPQVARRLIPHIAGQQDLDAIRTSYPLQHYVVALYRTQWNGKFDDDEVVEFVRRNGAPAVMMWIRRRSSAKSLADNNEEGRRYDPRFVARLRDAGAVTYVHSTGDGEAMRPFAEEKIGVYSDGPLGPDSPVPVPPPAGVPPVPPPTVVPDGVVAA